MTDLSKSPPSGASNPLPRVPRRRRWLMVLLAVVIFFTGVIVGGASTLALVIHRVEDALENPQHFPERATKRLTRRLGLTEVQADRIKSIFTERQRALFQIRKGVLPQVKAEFELLRRDVADVLDDEQRTEWERVFHSLERRWIRPNLSEEGSNAKAVPG